MKTTVPYNREQDLQTCTCTSSDINPNYVYESSKDLNYTYNPEKDLHMNMTSYPETGSLENTEIWICPQCGTVMLLHEHVCSNCNYVKTV